MNVVTNHTDKYALYRELNKNLYESIIEAIGDANENYVLCMKPNCGDGAETAYRKWMGLITLSAIISNATQVGSESLEDVLEANNLCTC